MPFDGQLPKQDVYSLQSLIAWLETRDPAETYDFLDHTDCLICRYLKAVDAFDLDVSGVNYMRMSRVRAGDGDIGDLAYASPQTMGAALSRARALAEAS